MDLPLRFRSGGLNPGMPPDGVTRAIPPRTSAEATYLRVDGRSLVAFWHQSPLRRGVPLVICSTLGYEQLFLSTGLRVLADQLTQLGTPAVRFDYDGTGNSEGDDSDPGRLLLWRRSIEAAIEFAKRRSGSAVVDLLGVRLGGAIAASLATDRHDVRDLILWNPQSGRQWAKATRAFTRLAHRTAASRGNELPAGASPWIEANGHTFCDADLTEIGNWQLPAPLFPARLRRGLLLADSDVPTPSGADGCSDVVRLPTPGFQGFLHAADRSRVPIEEFGSIARFLAGPHDPLPEPAAASDPGGPSPIARMRQATEELVWCDEDRTLFGVLSTPVAGRSDALAVLLTGAAMPSVGTHRLWVHVARALAGQGIASLRADVLGIGESALPDSVEPYHPYAPERADDVARIVDYAIARGFTKIHLIGLCSGAFLAYHASVRHPRPEIRGLFLINLQKVVWEDGDDLDVNPLADASEAQQILSAFRSASSWRKVLTGRADYVGISRTLARRSAFAARAAFGAVRARLPLGETPPVARTFERLLREGVRIDYVMSAGDPSTAMLDVLLGNARRRFADRYAFHATTVDGVDHSFTPRWATNTLIGLIRRSFDDGAAPQRAVYSGVAEIDHRN